MWIKLTDGRPATGETIYFFGVNDQLDHNTVRAGIKSNTHRVEFEYDDGSTSSIARHVDKTFTDGPQDWANFTFVADMTTSQLDIYLDGQKLTLHGTYDGSLANITPSSFTSSNNLYVGTRNDDGSIPAELGEPCKIDEFAIWSTALSSNEIQAIYNNGSPINLISNNGNYTSSSDLEGYWRLNDGSGTTAVDETGNSNATLYGSPSWTSSDVP
jgi:hypothetical protein